MTQWSQEFLNNVQGNPQWAQLVRARQLRRKQQMQQFDFDPAPKDLIPVIGKNWKPTQQPPVNEVHVAREEEEEPSFVEDPYNILGGEVEADGIPKKQPKLTEVVLAQKNKEENQRQNAIARNANNEDSRWIQ